MAPREHDIIKPTVRLINAVFTRVDRIFRVRVALKGIGIDDLVGELASNDKCVLFSGPSVITSIQHTENSKAYPDDVPLPSANNKRSGFSFIWKLNKKWRTLIQIGIRAFRDHVPDRPPANEIHNQF
jgi:hypothetical protein